MPPKRRTGTAFAIAAGMLFALGAGSAAGESSRSLPDGYEPCFGVAKAGRNDCRSGRHVCSGRQRIDRDPASFIWLPTGLCEKIAGSSLTGTIPAADEQN